MFRCAVHICDATPGRRRRPRRGLGHSASNAAHTRTPPPTRCRRRPPRSPGSPPTPTSGWSSPASTTGWPAPCTSCARRCSPVHSDTAIYVMHLQVIESFRRHGVGRALHGGHGLLGRGEGHRARRRGGLRGAPATPTASWPGSASARSRSSAARPSRRCAPSSPWSRRPPPAWAPAATATWVSVLAQRRSQRRSQARPS